MKIELEIADWEEAKKQNINLIKMNLQQIDMAYEVIQLCDKKIKCLNQKKKK